MIKASCHCGYVQLKVSEKPKWLTDCNCSVCLRYGALWGHISTANVEINVDESTIAYVRGDKSIAFHTCSNCGCTTHWKNLLDQDGRMAVNFRMCSTKDIARFTIKQFDGAESWSYID